MRALALVALLVLAGCADAPDTPDDEGPELEVTSTTGGIRGVVIDQAITPVVDAVVGLVGTESTTTTDVDGLFTFTGLEPGTYFLDVSKPLYESVQTSVEVEANVAEPPLVKVALARIPGLNPYVEAVQFDGFYECAFALVFITDSCDFGPRTVHDAGAEPVPRSVQNNVNTHYATFSDGIQTVVQETWWDSSSSRTFRSSLQDTPIENSCDCSTKHMEAKGEGGYIFDRMDKDNLGEKNTGGGQSWPAMEDLVDGQVAIRGFIPFQDSATDVDYAINLEFQIFTIFFHSFVPHPDWSFETQDQYPVPV